MAFVTPSTWVAGAKLLAAELNQQLRDNMNALWPYTTKGDIAVASAATVLQRVPVGSNGQTLTAASGETSGVKWATNNGGASLTRATTQSIPTGEWTSIQFTAEAFDTNGYTDIGTNNTRITIPANMTGYYTVSGYAIFAASGATANGTRELRVAKNATPTELFGITIPDPTDNTAVRLCCSNVVSLTAGDYLQLQAYNTHTALNITAAAFSIELVRLA